MNVINHMFGFVVDGLNVGDNDLFVAAMEIIDQINNVRNISSLEEHQVQMLMFWLIKKMLAPGVDKARAYYYEVFLELESKLEEAVTE